MITYSLSFKIRMQNITFDQSYINFFDYSSQVMYLMRFKVFLSLEECVSLQPKLPLLFAFTVQPERAYFQRTPFSEIIHTFCLKDEYFCEILEIT